MTDRVLLDTCALIWIGNKDPIAPEALTHLVASTLNGQVYVSPISAWEIGMLAAKGRLGTVTTASTAEYWFNAIMSRNGVIPAPLTLSIAVASAHLPDLVHRDPADRFLIATARALHVPIMTRDAEILAYAAHGHVAAVPC